MDLKKVIKFKLDYIWFSGGSVGKESAYNVGDLILIPGLRSSPGEGNSYLLHYSGLENSLDCIVHRVAKWLYMEVSIHDEKKKVGYMLREKALGGLSQETAVWQPKRERP